MLWRCGGCCGGVRAAAKCKGVMELLGLLLRCRGFCDGMVTAVEVWRVLWMCVRCCGGVGML